MNSKDSFKKISKTDMLLIILILIDLISHNTSKLSTSLSIIILIAAIMEFIIVTFAFICDSIACYKLHKKLKYAIKHEFGFTKIDDSNYKIEIVGDKENKDIYGIIKFETEEENKDKENNSNVICVLK